MKPKLVLLWRHGTLILFVFNSEAPFAKYSDNNNYKSKYIVRFTVGTEIYKQSNTPMVWLHAIELFYSNPLPTHSLREQL